MTETIWEYLSVYAECCGILLPPVALIALWLLSRKVRHPFVLCFFIAQLLWAIQTYRYHFFPLDGIITQPSWQMFHWLTESVCLTAHLLGFIMLAIFTVQKKAANQQNQPIVGKPGAD